MVQPRNGAPRKAAACRGHCSARGVLTGELLLELPHQGGRLLLLLRLLQTLSGKLQS